MLQYILVNNKKNSNSISRDVMADHNNQTFKINQMLKLQVDGQNQNNVAQDALIKWTILKCIILRLYVFRVFFDKKETYFS